MKPKSTVASRLACLKELTKQVQTPGRGWHAEQLESFRDKALRAFSEGDDSRAIGTATLCAVAHLSVEFVEEGWSSIVRKDLHGFLTYARLNAHVWEARGCIKSDTEDHVADHAGNALVPTHWAALLVASMGEWAQARWLARYLLEFYEAGSLREPREGDQHDGPYFHVLKLLLTVLRDGHWPAVFGAELGPYQRLLQQRCDPEAVKSALVPVMDLRMARNNGYPDVDAPKRLHALDSNVIGGTAYAVLPAELWAIQALTKRLDGCEMSLDGEHPWLLAPFMTPPPGPVEPWSDALTQALFRLGDERYGAKWLSEDV